MEFSMEDLRLIKAMCITANPWFPDRKMIYAWESVYTKAAMILEEKEDS